MGKACSVPVIVVLLAFLSCSLFLVHGLYGLIKLFGSPDLSPEATILIYASCFLVLAAAVAGGGCGRRRALLPTDGGTGGAVISRSRGGQAVPTSTTAEEAMATGEELPLLVADEEETVARRVDLQIQDYPGSGANSRHDPRNPH